MALRDWIPGRKKAIPADRALADTFRRALLAVLEGDTEEAERLITLAVKADSDDVEPYRSLARLYRVRGEVGRAIRIHQNLLLRRDLPDTQRNAVLLELADDFRAGGFLKRAIASYEEALEHDARNADALRALVELHAEEGSHAEALTAARRLARIEGRDPVSEARLQVRLAEEEHAAGRSDVARKAVKRALRRDPGSEDARMLLAELEAERGRDKAALAAWREVAQEGGPRSAEAHPRLAAAFAAVGRARNYETFVRAVLDGRPDDAIARTALARALAARGETDAAVLELRRVLDLHPSDLQARVALGELLLDAGREADALKEYGELLARLAARPSPGPWPGEDEGDA